MTRNLTGQRTKVKRFKTLDRRRGFVTPSESDVLCPFFQHTWIKMKDAGYLPDYIPLCTKHDSDCDYRNTLVEGQISLCYRYQKISNDNFKKLI
jgi:hypothetical protein